MAAHSLASSLIPSPIPVFATPTHHVGTVQELVALVAHALVDMEAGKSVVTMSLVSKAWQRAVSPALMEFGSSHLTDKQDVWESRGPICLAKVRYMQFIRPRVTYPILARPIFSSLSHMSNKLTHLSIIDQHLTLAGWRIPLGMEFPKLKELRLICVIPGPDVLTHHMGLRPWEDGWFGNMDMMWRDWIGRTDEEKNRLPQDIFPVLESIQIVVDERLETQKNNFDVWYQNFLTEFLFVRKLTVEMRKIPYYGLSGQDDTRQVENPTPLELEIHLRYQILGAENEAPSTEITIRRGFPVDYVAEIARDRGANGGIVRRQWMAEGNPQMAAIVAAMELISANDIHKSGDRRLRLDPKEEGDLLGLTIKLIAPNHSSRSLARPLETYLPTSDVIKEYFQRVIYAGDSNERKIELAYICEWQDSQPGYITQINRGELFRWTGTKNSAGAIGKRGIRCVSRLDEYQVNGLLGGFVGV